MARPPKITMEDMGLIAKMRIIRPEGNEDKPEYTKEELLGFLHQVGISYGIKEEVLEEICADLSYDKDYIVAEGKEASLGTDGYFEYHFSQEFSNKPTIREDGSADFLTIKVIEVVHEDDLIATYHPAVQGEHGTSVKGSAIAPKVARELPPLGGRGFHRSEDNLSYYSDMDGKIEMQGNRILISPVYEISRDADMTVGNIDFKGDVVIHGGVKHGINIHATGSITIDGLVEHCNLSAGKNIFLLSGVKGAEKTLIEAAGNITAEFIEYAKVSCKGDLHASVLFNCQVDCESRIIVTSGKRSAIIGGSAVAVQGLSALNLGNKFGTITRVTVGMDDARLREMMQLREKIATLESNISKIKQGVKDFDEMSEKRGISNKDDPRRMQLLRVKIRDEAIVAQDRHRLEELEIVQQGCRYATIKVYDTVYAGVLVKMSEQYAHMSDYQKKVEFVKTETGIRMEPLDEPIPEE